MSVDHRPTSPHLTIYRPQISSVLSIMHRLTGVWLSFGAALVVGWLYIVAYAPASYQMWHECFSSLLGQLVLMSWVFAFYFHLCSGIRHLFWDIGKGFKISQVNASGWMVVLASIVLTTLTWGFVHSMAEQL